MMERVAFPGVIRAGRREMLRMAAGATAGMIIGRARADDRATMTFPFANGQREIVPAGAFPEKGPMILQRTRAPVLETPWESLTSHIFTPNDQFYVRWHFADFPNRIEVSPDTFRLRISGEVSRQVSYVCNRAGPSCGGDAGLGGRTRARRAPNFRLDHQIF